MNTKLIIIIVLFLIGLYFCSTYKSGDLLENFKSSDLSNCPDLLIKKGNALHLLNSRKAKIPGVNPIKFNNLEEYAEYIKWSKKVGINCPILYFEQSYTTQNERGFRMLNDPLNPQAGLPSNNIQRTATTQLLTDANRDDPPFNQNNFSGFDGEDQYIGVKTPLDGIGLQTDKGSLTPVDSNWCGASCTQKAVDNGKFNDRTRKILTAKDSVDR